MPNHIDEEAAVAVHNLARQVANMIRASKSRCPGCWENDKAVVKLDGFRYEEQGPAGHAVEHRDSAAFDRWNHTFGALRVAVRDTDEYSRCREELARCLSGDEADANRLADWFATMCLLYEVDDSLATRAADTFVKEQLGQPYLRTTRARLMAIDPGGSPLSLGTGRVLRRVSDDDVVSWPGVQPGGLGQVSPNLNRLTLDGRKRISPATVGSAVLEIERLCRNVDDEFQFLTQTIWAFRLVRLGAVEVATLESEALTTHVTTFRDAWRPGLATRPICRLCADDIPALLWLEECCGDTLAALPSDTRKNVVHFHTASRMFKSAIQHYEKNPILSMTEAVGCLEALLLEGGGQGEIAYRLSTRAAVLLRPFGFDGQAVYRLVKQAYGVRSTHLHGGFVKSAKGGWDRVANAIVEIARMTLLVLLLVQNEAEKGSLLSQLQVASVSAYDPPCLVNLATSGRVHLDRILNRAVLENLAP